MALINKIREKTGLAVGIVAFGLMLFIVGGDILGPNSVILGSNKRDVGEIAGEAVSLEEFQQQVEEMKYNYTINFGRNPTESELNSIRQQAWEFLIVKIAFQKQFDELGIEVTEEELVDMVQGKNIHPELANAFTDPETGEVNRDQIISYLQNISQLPQQQQAGWYLFEKNLKPSRLRIKYDNLLILSDYVTEAEARNQYVQENKVAEVRYLYVPYYSVNDSLVSVEEAELRRYLQNNEDQYQVEESRSIKYVRFPIVPSAEDTTYFREELNRLKEEFRQVEDDSLFAKRYSDAQNFYRTFSIADLPDPLKANVSNISVGDVRGPYLQNGNLLLYKIVEQYQDDSLATARARHILIRSEGTTDEAKTEARNEAQRILNEIRGGADFAEMARQYSDDPSKSQGGDLGWFSKGRMVPPFEEAVFNRNSAGLVNRVIETEYGYHIIEVTEAANDQVYDVAVIEREITPSDATTNEAYRQAALFASASEDYDTFMEAANEDSLQIFDGEKLGKNARRINNLADARQIIRWAFNDAVVNEVSDVFETESEYVVAVMTEKTNEGVAELEDVREEIEEIVKNEKKAAIIKDKLANASGTLDEIAESYGEDARVLTSSNLKLNANNLPSAGSVPKVIGAAFGLDQGQRSQPLESENGVVIVELEAITEAPEIADYSTYKQQISQQRTGSVSFYLSEIVKDFSNIEDNRHRFY